MVMMLPKSAICILAQMIFGYILGFWFIINKDVQNDLKRAARTRNLLIVPTVQ